MDYDKKRMEKSVEKQDPGGGGSGHHYYTGNLCGPVSEIHVGSLWKPGSASGGCSQS